MRHRKATKRLQENTKNKRRVWHSAEPTAIATAVTAVAVVMASTQASWYIVLLVLVLDLLAAKRRALWHKVSHELLDVELHAVGEREEAVGGVQLDQRRDRAVARRASAHELDGEIIRRVRWRDERVARVLLALFERRLGREAKKLEQFAVGARLRGPGGDRGGGESGKSEELHGGGGGREGGGGSLERKKADWRMRDWSREALQRDRSAGGALQA